MRELGLYDLTPAMCHLDYTMAEAGGAADFMREYTLASGSRTATADIKRKRKIDTAIKSAMHVFC